MHIGKLILPCIFAMLVFTPAYSQDDTPFFDVYAGMEHFGASVGMPINPSFSFAINLARYFRAAKPDRTEMKSLSAGFDAEYHYKLFLLGVGSGFISMTSSNGEHQGGIRGLVRSFVGLRLRCVRLLFGADSLSMFAGVGYQL
ncbi:hypothetical protein HY491_03920 [Candidatus Woesearchaeota archaeon]|nr:hypothetical protein [Candidatus Woesearchaeota archaeon]